MEFDDCEKMDNPIDGYMLNLTRTKLEAIRISLNLEKDLIILKDSNNSNIKTINFERISEIRLQPDTDAWLNLTRNKFSRLLSEAGIKDFKSNDMNYFSLVYNSNNKFRVAKTEDFMFSNKNEDSKNVFNMIEKHFERISKRKVQLLLSKHRKFIEQVNNNTLTDIFKEFSNGKNGIFIDADGLFDLLQYQKEGKRQEKTSIPSVNYSECTNLIIQINFKFRNNNSNELDLVGFHRLFEEQFALFNPKHRNISSTDMVHPMTHYFIASSHNSYLSGNQFTSKSSYEMYRKILLDGCRCIELDVWFRKNRLVVTHGLSPTSSILLSKVLKVIKDYAFVRSHYALILSIENHLCKTEHENLMAEMMKVILGDKLYVEKVNEERGTFLPLDKTTNKIFIKASQKKPEDLKLQIKEFFSNIRILPRKNYELSEEDYQSEDEDGDNESYNYNLNGDFDHYDSDDDNLSVDSSCELESDFKNEILKCWIGQYENDEEDDDEDEDEDEEEEEFNKSIFYQEKFEVDEEVEDSIFSKFNLRKNEVEIKRNFLDLINYFEAKKFTTIDELKEFEYYHMFSRDYIESKEMLEEHPKDYQIFTSEHMARTYPRFMSKRKLLTKPSQIVSFNYNPVRHWHAGAQMVALNYQVNDVQMLINRAMFALYDNCGYVLKPEYLRISNEKSVTKILKIQILSGSFWDLINLQYCTGKVDLKVLIRVYCPDPDTRIQMKLGKETKGSKNENNPIWNESFEFKLLFPELSFVQISLKNGNSFIGHHMIAFPAMQKGYRWIHLHDDNVKRTSCARIYLHVDYHSSS